MENKGRKHAEIRCFCGRTFKVRLSMADKIDPTKCRCSRRESSSKAATKHGLSNTSEYVIWTNIKDRCYRHKNPHFQNYGGRGICMSESWINSFENFLKDMGKRPSNKHSIERKDNNGNYCKENCSWVTRVEQCNNRRSNRLVTVNGETMNVKQLSDKYGLSCGMIRARIKRGWPNERLVEPQKK